MLIAGACLCGAVRYEINGQLRDAGNCHCSMCRKAHGAGFATYASIARWVNITPPIGLASSAGGGSRI